jgi:hypothetical protein
MAPTMGSPKFRGDADVPLINNSPGEAQLFGLAGLGVGLMGFVSTISTFRPANATWSSRELAALNLIMDHALGLIALSLLPLISVHLWNTRAAWRLMNIPLALFLAWELISNVSKAWTLMQIGQGPRHSVLFWGIFVPGTLLFTILTLSNIRKGSTANYILALYWVLSSVGIQFYLIIRALLHV